jgi:crossover junction endodeoxyribonuclease RuvC
MKILGIDSGNTGCLAYYDGTELLLWDMPTFNKEKGVDLDVNKIYKIFKDADCEKCYIEKTVAMPKISGKAAYSMGKGEGILITCCVALDLPYTLVRPAEWKKAMQCPAEKDASRQRASQLLPAFSHNWDRKKDHGRAEAALIALYGFKNETK